MWLNDPHWKVSQRLCPLDYHAVLDDDLGDGSPAVFQLVRSPIAVLSDMALLATAAGRRHSAAPSTLCAERLHGYSAIAGQRHVRRVRVVDLPAARMTRDELRRLHTHAEAHIRVVTGAQIARLEHAGRLPNIIVVGQVVYHVVYGRTGVVVGAQRLVGDDAIADWWRVVISRCYDQGECAAAFCRRVLALDAAVSVPGPRRPAVGELAAEGMLL